MSVIKKPKTDHFHGEWYENYLFNLIKENCVCPICNFIIQSRKVKCKQTFILFKKGKFLNIF